MVVNTHKNNKNFSSEAMQHYATKDFVWGKIWIMAGAISVAYFIITPMIIDSHLKIYDKKLDEILEKVTIPLKHQ